MFEEVVSCIESYLRLDSPSQPISCPILRERGRNLLMWGVSLPYSEAPVKEQRLVSNLVFSVHPHLCCQSAPISLRVVFLIRNTVVDSSPLDARIVDQYLFSCNERSCSRLDLVSICRLESQIARLRPEFGFKAASPFPLLGSSMIGLMFKVVRKS